MTAAFADCVHIPCPQCQAPAGETCVNRKIGKRAHSPCYERLRAAEIKES